MLTTIQNIYKLKNLNTGHTGKMSLHCENQQCMEVDTSPHLPGGSFLTNFRILHARFLSGLRYTQYERFATSAGFGLLSETFVSGLLDLYCLKMRDIADRSAEETAITTLKCSDNNSDFIGITIITDARHGWQKYARHSDVVAIGFNTLTVVGLEVVGLEVVGLEVIGLEVIGLEVVTTDDDPVSQT